MNKEEIEKAKTGLWNIRADCLKIMQCGLSNRQDKEECLKEIDVIDDIFKYIQELEQKESILDKVTKYIENYIDDKQNEYEAISESYICQTDEDEYIKEKELAIIKGQKQVLRNVLNSIKGEKK